jgi:hypothetical protein
MCDASRVNSNPPIACSLSSTDALARQAEWEELLRRARVRTAERVEFPPDPYLRAELVRLVELERECCPFFDLQIEHRGRALVLKASAPPEAEPLLRELLSVDERP